MVERIGSQGLKTTAEAPDHFPRRSVVKTWLMLFVMSVIVCWIAQEVVAALAIAIPLAAVLVFHGAFIAVVLVLYPFTIMRSNKRSGLEVR
jgi:heme/copper-type cytochrome/quinol oxidase subunit 4